MRTQKCSISISTICGRRRIRVDRIMNNDDEVTAIDSDDEDPTTEYISPTGERTLKHYVSDESDHVMDTSPNENHSATDEPATKHSASDDVTTEISMEENNCSNDSHLDTFNQRMICCSQRSSSNIFKGCKWSPDTIGNRVLTCDSVNALRIYHCFLNKVDYTSSQFSEDVLEIQKIGKVYDYDWYPVISPFDYYIIVASSLGPLHIYNVSTRKCIASYQMFSLKDEMVHANCVACFPDGGKILGATTDYIFLFDVNQPGRTYERIQCRKHFRKGILSSIAVNPGRYSMFAVGSYNHRIGIYDGQDLLCLLHGHKKGITHLKFSPNGTLLYSGSRGSGEMICWDLRNPGTALYKLERVVKTQQRIYFDITADSKYVYSGSTDGDIYVYDTTLPPQDSVLPPVCKFKAHDDCANGISVHPTLPFFVTTSGQYHDTHLSDILQQYDSEDDTTIDQSHFPNEYSLKLWHIGAN